MQFLKSFVKLIKMKKLTITLLFIIFAVSSCTNVQTTSYFSSSKVKLSDFSALEIREFESAAENFPEDALTIIPNLIAEKLNQKKLSFKKVSFGEIDSVSPDETLVLLGEVTKYVGGGDVNYSSGNVKFGEVDINIDIVILQKSNGRDIASGEVSSVNTASFLGGSDKMYNQIADEVVKYILKNY